MKKYDHLKKKALLFRQKGMSLLDICERLKLCKGTVYYWIKEIPLSEVTKKQKASVIAAGKASHRKFKKLREEAYELGVKEYPKLMKENDFRDFVMLYLTEGYRRSVNTASVANSNKNLIGLAYKWIKKLANPERKLSFSIQCHEDNDENNLKIYWSKILKIDKSLIKVTRKSNSGKMSGRNWRSEYGVFTVCCCDTYLRSRIESWMDLLQKEWK